MQLDISSLAPQPPLSFEAATRYAETVLGWVKDVPDGQVVAQNIPYGPDPAHRYDVYGDPHAKGQPVLIFWHGGGWINGYKEWCAFMATAAVKSGVKLVAPDYRLAPEHKLGAAFEDCLSLLRHVVDNAADYGGDGGRLVLSGHSAGGHLAALCAMRTDELARSGIPLEAIRACMPVSAILDLHHPVPPPNSLEEFVYTKVLAKPDDDVVLSPLSWTRGNTVPTLLTFGEHDSDRVRRSNRRMFEMLKLQKAETELVMDMGKDHFMTHTQLADPAAPWYAALKRLVAGRDAA